MPGYRFRTIEFGEADIHGRTLRDRQQVEDFDQVAESFGIPPSSWPLFGLIWPSGEILARLNFDYDIVGKRILEVGCGVGLASLVLNHRQADITATDHHPEVAGFLSFNTELHQDASIPFVRTDWLDKQDSLATYDLIIGRDLPQCAREHACLVAPAPGATPGGDIRSSVNAIRCGTVPRPGRVPLGSSTEN